VRANKLKEIWARGDAAVNGWLSIPSAFSAEVMSHQGFDSLTIDMQHGVVDYQAAVELVCQRCLEPFRHELAQSVNVVVADSDSLPATVPEGFEPFEVAGGRFQPVELVEIESPAQLRVAAQRPGAAARRVEEHAVEARSERRPRGVRGDKRKLESEAPQVGPQARQAARIDGMTPAALTLVLAVSRRRAWRRNS